MFSQTIGRSPVKRHVAPWLIALFVATTAAADQPTIPVPDLLSPAAATTESPAPAAPVVSTPLTAPATSPAAPVVTSPVVTTPIVAPTTAPANVALPAPTSIPAIPTATIPVATGAAPIGGLAGTGTGEPIVHRVQAATERLEMTVNSSRILTLDQPIPRLVVGNPDLVQATPLSPNEVQVFAKKVGATQVNLFNDKGQVYSVDCIIYGDVRQLADLLRAEFPTANISVKAIAEGHVLLTGYVDRSDHIAQIVQLAHTFFPGANQADDRVISNIEVVGVQQILLKVKVAEVSRTKLRQLGMDWANLHGLSFAVSSIGDVIANTQAITGSSGTGLDTMRFGVVNGGSKFFGFIQALQQEDLVKILAEPDVATVSGRPAQFRAGGQVPYPSSTSINGVSVSYMDTGVTVDFLPIVLGNGNVRLEVRPVVRELDETVSVQISPGVFAPGFTERKVDTGVEMKPGQTLALAGLVSQRVIANKTGFPWIGDLPYLGVPFRRVKQTTEDVELLILCTPELVAATDCAETPPCLPGMHTDVPNDCEMYLKGYIEVPTKGPCGINGCQGPGAGPMPTEAAPGMMNPGVAPEQIPSGMTTPAGPPQARYNVSPGVIGTTASTAPPVRVAQAPTNGPLIRSSTPPANASNQYNPSHAQDPHSTGSPVGAVQSPGYRGPVGYDVLN